MKKLLLIALLATAPFVAIAEEVNEIDLTIRYAEQGDPEAQFVLANLYAQGRGVERSDKQALAWYEKAARGGYAQAQYRLGTLHLDGKLGLIEDPEAAFRWFRQAADQRHRVAEFHVGNLIFKGHGVEQDRETGMQWLHRSAENRCKRAKVRLAQIYDRGIGIPEDKALALQWYLKSAKMSYAQRALGRMYRTGDGVEQDVAEAVKWYQKAAEHKKAKRGSKAKAQFALGEIFLNGEGNVPADRKEAYKWLKMAAEANYEPAKALLAK